MPINLNELRSAVKLGLGFGTGNQQPKANRPISIPIPAPKPKTSLKPKIETVNKVLEPKVAEPRATFPKLNEEQQRALFDYMLGTGVGVHELPEERKVSPHESALRAVSKSLLGAQVSGGRAGVSAVFPGVTPKVGLTDFEKRLSILKAIPRGAFGLGGAAGQKLSYISGYKPEKTEATSNEELRNLIETEIFEELGGEAEFGSVQEFIQENPELIQGVLRKNFPEKVKQFQNLRQPTGKFYLEEQAR